MKYISWTDLAEIIYWLIDNIDFTAIDKKDHYQKEKLIDSCYSELIKKMK